MQLSKAKVLSLLLGFWLAGEAWAKPLTPYNQGYDQGRQAGRREGRERGGDYGRIDGEQDGYNAGYQEALQGYATQAQEEGRRAGLAQGSQDGEIQGSQDGIRFGTEEGEREGAVAGEASANETALKEVTPEATTAGLQRARAANPVADGKREGKLDGLKRAREQARREDYEQARTAYREERYQEAPTKLVEQRQSQLSWSSSWPSELDWEVGRRPRPACDFRYCSYPSDNEEFQKAYRKGYRAGYCDGFDNQYQWYYDIEFRRAASWGASQARPGNLEDLTQESFQASYDKAFEQGYEKALAQSKERAYGKAFQTAFAESYSQFYPEYLTSHYKKVEQAAFDSLYKERYLEYHEAASDEWYHRSLQKARDEARTQGLADEASDFETRPVRLLEAWVSPTDVGDIALLTVKLRNFSSQTVAGYRVHMIWGEERSRLYHNLPPNSVATVTGVFRTRTGTLPAHDLKATLKRGEQSLSLGSVAVLTQETEE